MQGPQGRGLPATELQPGGARGALRPRRGRLLAQEGRAVGPLQEEGRRGLLLLLGLGGGSEEGAEDGGEAWDAEAVVGLGVRLLPEAARLVEEAEERLDGQEERGEGALAGAGGGGAGVVVGEGEAEEAGDLVGGCVCLCVCTSVRF